MAAGGGAILLEGSLLYRKNNMEHEKEYEAYVYDATGMHPSSPNRLVNYIRSPYDCPTATSHQGPRLRQRLQPAVPWSVLNTLPEGIVYVHQQKSYKIPALDFWPFCIPFSISTSCNWSKHIREWAD